MLAALIGPVRPGSLSAMCDEFGAWHVRRSAQFRSLVGALGGRRGQETLRDRRSFVPSVGRPADRYGTYTLPAVCRRY